MGNREQLDHLMAQWHECPVPEAAARLDLVFSAFKQAMAELSIPDHPGGQCPAAPCDCSALLELVTLRAAEILGLLDHHEAP